MVPSCILRNYLRAIASFNEFNSEIQESTSDLNIIFEALKVRIYLFWLIKLFLAWQYLTSDASLSFAYFESDSSSEILHF